MATAIDLFAGALTAAVLSASGEDVQSAVVDDMVERLDRDGDLDTQIARYRVTRKEAGDFGMEIVGALLVPVLIDAAKGLWAAYVKKLSEQAGGQLADLTYKQAAKLLNWLWTGDVRDRVDTDFEGLLKVAASQRGLTPEQIETLVVAVRSPKMREILEAHTKA